MTKKLLILFIVYSSSFIVANAQLKSGEFFFGGGTDVAHSVIQSIYGGFNGYVIAGYTSSYGAGMRDFYIVKLDSVGKLIWTRTIGNVDEEIAYSITQSITADGVTYAVAGTTWSCGDCPSQEPYIAKLDANGNVLWAKGYTGEAGGAIASTKDGGYIMTGTDDKKASAEMYVMKINSNGMPLWGTGIYGKTVYEGGTGNSVIQTKDGGYAATGTSSGYGDTVNGDVYVVRLDSMGTIIWAETIGGSGTDIGNSIIQTSDSGYAIAGATNSYGAGNYDVYVIKLSSSGKLEWTRTIGGLKDDEGYSIVQTTDKGFAIAGFSNSYDTIGGYYIYVIRLDSSGNQEWVKTIGTSYCQGYSIVQTRDKGFAIAGSGSSSYMYFVKLDSSGNTCSAVTRTAIIDSGGIVNSGYKTYNDTASSLFYSISSGGIDSTICILITGIDNISLPGIKASIYPQPIYH
jgi:hypothetical protein